MYISLEPLEMQHASPAAYPIDHNFSYQVGGGGGLRLFNDALGHSYSGSGHTDSLLYLCNILERPPHMTNKVL